LLQTGTHFAISIAILAGDNLNRIADEIPNDLLAGIK
jgi:hypothetical protein